MKLQYFIFWVLSITLISCGSTKNTPSEEQFNTLALLVKTQSFSIESDWAYPQATYALQQVLNSGLLQPGNSANAINLIGNSNFLTIKGDSITSYLPYFGERQMNVQYGGGDSAIQFSGLLEDYKITKNNNESYTISFEAKSKSENFNASIIIFPSLKSDIILNGNGRSSIRYSGTVKELILE